MGSSRGGPPRDAAEREAHVGHLCEPARARATQKLYGSFAAREFAEAITGRWRRERLTVPTLMVHGDADRAIRPDFLRGYERHASDFRLEMLDGVGHFLCDAEPEGVANRMLAFLRPLRTDGEPVSVTHPPRLTATDSPSPAQMATGGAASLDEWVLDALALCSPAG